MEESISPIAKLLMNRTQSIPKQSRANPMLCRAEEVLPREGSSNFESVPSTAMIFKKSCVFDDVRKTC